MIIDECPAVALDYFDDPLLENHLKENHANHWRDEGSILPLVRFSEQLVI